LRETSDKGLSFTGNRDPKIQLWGEGFSRRGQWCCEREESILRDDPVVVEVVNG